MKHLWRKQSSTTDNERSSDISFVPRSKRHPATASPANSLITIDYMAALLSGKHSDMCIELANGALHVHSFVLRMQSPYFEALFSAPTTTTENQERRVSLSEFSDEVVLDMLESFYSCACGHMSGCSWVEIEALMQLLSYLQAQDTMAVLVRVMEVKYKTIDKRQPAKLAATKYLVEYLHRSLFQLEKSYQLPMKTFLESIFSHTFENVNTTISHLFCDLHHEHLGRIVACHSLSPELLVCLAKWNSTDPLARTPLLVSILKQVNGRDRGRVSCAIHKYAVNPALMYAEGKGVHPTREDMAELVLVLTILDRDAIMSAWQTGNNFNSQLWV